MFRADIRLPFESSSHIVILCCSERLCSSLDSAWEEQREVDLVDIWNNPDLYPQSLSQNAKGLLAQVRTPIS